MRHRADRPYRQRHHSATLRVALAIALAFIPMQVLPAAGGRIAGLVPHERPAGGPVKTEVTGLGERGFQGIEGVPPASLERLKGSQGEWYTPFSRAGMSGPYDLRGWHRAAEGRAGKAAPGAP